MKGIMVYDGSGEESNARDIFEAGREFNLVEPEKLLNSSSAGKTYLRLKPGSGNEPERYILFEKLDTDPVQVKIIWDDAYTPDAVVVPETPPLINEGNLLGYGFKPPYLINEHYDLVLF
ncbi:MAG: hypothetical protein FWG99_07575, partial [Treponema sp.]|nr:hypothetical protein [Treponema sp.]